MTLDATGDSAVQLHLESPSGDLGAAMGVMDVIDTMGVPVTGVAMGMVGGPAVGSWPPARKRVAMPHARFHLCEPHASFSGRRPHRSSGGSNTGGVSGPTYCERLAARLGEPADEIEAAVRRRAATSAPRRRWRLGLVHEVARAQGEITALRSGAGYGV